MLMILYRFIESFSVAFFFALVNNIVRAPLAGNVQPDIELLRAVITSFEEDNRRTKIHTYCRKISQLCQTLLSIIYIVKGDNPIHQYLPPITAGSELPPPSMSGVSRYQVPQLASSVDDVVAPEPSYDENLSRTSGLLKRAPDGDHSIDFTRPASNTNKRHQPDAIRLSDNFGEDFFFSPSFEPSNFAYAFGE